MSYSFTGTDFVELGTALANTEPPDHGEDSEWVIGVIMRHPDKNAALEACYEYLVAHIKHLQEHPISNKTDYIPIYQQLEILYHDESKYSFLAMFYCLLPFMWC